MNSLEEAQTLIGYLKKQLGGKGDFMKEYQRLTTEERASLRTYAEEEMNLLGIKVKSSK